MFPSMSNTVLIIENEPFVLDAMEEILISAGINPICVQSGTQGVTTYKERSSEIGAVILDVNLPGLDGPGVFRVLKDANPQVKVIVSSGYEETDVLNRFDNSTDISILKKPFNAKMLIDSVQSVLSA